MEALVIQLDKKLYNKIIQFAQHLLELKIKRKESGYL